MTIGDIRIPSDRLWFAGIIIALTIVIILAFRLTRFGLATRAAAESETGALVSGLSPERIAYANWALSTMIAGLSGILIAPIVPLIPVSYTLFIVPALAAALVDNFSSIGPAVAAGLGITFTCNGEAVPGLVSLCSNTMIVLTMADGKLTDPHNVSVRPQ